MELFNHLYRIDLDLTGLCNKTCSFCPRTHVSYPNVNEHMSLETIKIVIAEMKSKGFSGWVELAGRGEPVLHNKFTDVVQMLTAEPRTWKVRVTTNGYKIDTHWKKSFAKIDHLILNTYTNQQDFEDRLAKYQYLHGTDRKVEHYFKPDGLTIEEINNLPPIEDNLQPGKFFNYVFNNRAGWFSDESVPTSCWHPMRQIFIDYKGNYQMCCNDWKYQIIIGNIHERGMFDMYENDPKLNRIRWSLLNNQRSDILPCSRCDDAQGGSRNTVKAIAKFKTTNEYKFHVAKIAGGEGAKYRKELQGGDFIPVFEEN